MNAPSAGALIELELEGMTCAACASRIERTLNRIEGVAANVNFATETAQVAVEPGAATVESLIDAVRRAGYDARVHEAGAVADHESDRRAALRKAKD